MSLAICIEGLSMPGEVIADALELAIRQNERLYRKLDLPAPWGLLWVPDQLVVCDGGVCRFADTSKLQLVDVLARAGQGSCHSLSCAYAAWLTVREATPSTAVAVPQGPARWHVYARTADGLRYDPQTIGTREAVASWR